MEEWIDVPDYDGIYKVSNFGNVASYKRGKCKLLKPRVINGYHHVDLYKNLKRITFGVHQLVAMVYYGFKKNNKDGFCVNHKNFKRSDNYKDNLEVITIRENSSKSSVNTRNGLIGTRYNKSSGTYISKIYYNKKNITLGVFNTEKEAHDCYLMALEGIGNGITPIRYKPKTSSDFIGVSFSSNKWKACITINKIFFNLGTYNTEQEAINARVLANEKLKNGQDIVPVLKEKTHELAGISFNSSINKWDCRLKINNKWEVIGRFDSSGLAVDAQNITRERLSCGERIDIIRFSFRKPNKYKRYRPLKNNPYLL